MLNVYNLCWTPPGQRQDTPCKPSHESFKTFLTHHPWSTFTPKRAFSITSCCELSGPEKEWQLQPNVSRRCHEVGLEQSDCVGWLFVSPTLSMTHQPSLLLLISHINACFQCSINYCCERGSRFRRSSAGFTAKSIILNIYSKANRDCETFRCQTFK